ncbi:hypothetical protein [Terracoccus sp. 273MFTsu3.1]|uniref:hypothetical protein n=1 Tax=Terracoccus sp. 273MFTsu3.1 TaxID=1172188 RepID=UPI0003707DAB|nr:hypothetical protein [Terracoccus sp. 273MFTsu3.1]
MSIRVTRARKVVVNPVINGYESIEMFASVADEFDVLPKDLDEWAQGYDGLIDRLLQGEMDAAAAVTSNEHSIVHDYRFTEKED